jgi:predicted enzyme related to lactoylglutathione lyase
MSILTGANDYLTRRLTVNPLSRMARASTAMSALAQCYTLITLTSLTGGEYDNALAKAQKLGGTISKPETAVPGMGYFVICLDTEGNTFALWEPNERAK